MNKLTKATIATAAGVALLLGTGGTLAYWNDQANLGGTAVITAGDLKIDRAGATTTWQLVRGTKTDTLQSPADAKIVPGDKLVYTTTFKIHAEGRNLALQADVAPGAVTPVSAASTADKALATYLTAPANLKGSVKIGTQPVVTMPASASFGPIGDGVQDIPVTVTYELTFPYDTAAGTENPAKIGKVDLSNFNVTVRQTINGA